MTLREFSDLVLGFIGDEMDDSFDGPFQAKQSETESTTRFRSERIGDALHVTEYVTGERFIIECRKAS